MKVEEEKTVRGMETEKRKTMRESMSEGGGGWGGSELLTPAEAVDVLAGSQGTGGRVC